MRVVESNDLFGVVIVQRSSGWVHFTSSCDKCVVRFDHHDILINNCVGYGNQHFFVLFLILGIMDSLIFLFKGVLIPLFTFGLTRRTFIVLLGIFIVD